MEPEELLAAIEDCHARGWTDGLPVVPPARPLVERMCAGTRLPPDELICRVPPAWGDATVEALAANAVMAGCLPEHLPVVIAAFRAMADRRFSLHGVQCTTHVCAPLLVVNGPVAADLGIQGAHNCFGQGWRANAAIGRAVRLALVNIGGAHPGRLDKATFGHPGKFTYCIAENETANPWEPLHVTRGFAPEQSTVTVFAAEAPHNVNNHHYEDFDLLAAIADTMCQLGQNNMYVMGDCMLVLGPDHARFLAEHGWKKRHIQRYLFEHARKSVGRLKAGGMYGRSVERNLWPRWVDRTDEDATVPPVREPDDIQVVVAGGEGPHSLYIPGWGTRAVTVAVGD